MKMILAAALVAACAVSALAGGSAQCVDDNGGIESALTQAQQVMSVEKKAEKAMPQAQPVEQAVEQRGGQRGPGGHGGHGGGHHREGRRQRRWGRYLCDEITYNVSAPDCSNLAWQEGWPVYALDGYVCLGCE